MLTKTTLLFVWVNTEITLISTPPLGSCPLLSKLISDLYKEGDGDKDGEDEHPAEPVEVEGPTSAPVHQGDGDQGHDDHDGPNPDGRVLRVGLRQAGGHEQVGRVVEDL